VFILSFPVRLEPSDTLVKHNVLLGYDALDMLMDMEMGMDIAYCVRDTYAPARFGELPLLSVPCKTDYLARSTCLPQEMGLDGLVNLRYILNSGRRPVTQPKILKPTIQLNITGPSPRWSKTAINPYIQLSNTGPRPRWYTYLSN
jgi:hypothetical protein